MDPVICSSCGARFPVDSLSEADYNSLRDQHYYQIFDEELKQLLKVQEYYRRHPAAEGCIKTDVARLLESDDPSIKDRLWAGVPFDQIDLPPENLPPGLEDGREDAEIANYLRHHDFSLGPRLAFVSENHARLKSSAGAVQCPHCKQGSLYVPPEDWDEFTARSAITWYWPDWHGVDSDGTLHVKSSGWGGEAHWNGEIAIKPDEPRYEFWRWFVEQTEYHRLVEENELKAIQEEWSRRTKHRINSEPRESK